MPDIEENYGIEIFERICDAFLALDNNLHLTYLNKVATSLINENAGYLIGKHISLMFPEERFPIFLDACNMALQKQQLVVQEEYLDNDTHFFQYRIYPSGGGLSILITDSTDRKKAEEKIVESELRFRTLTKYAPVGIFETDANGSTTYCRKMAVSTHHSRPIPRPI